MTEHKDNSKYIWGQFLFTKKKKKMLYWEEGKHATPVYFDAALWPKSEHSLRQRGKRGREGGATCRGSTHSTHVSTLVIFHYIFKSRVRWVRQTDRQRERGEQEMSGGRKKEGCWVDERAGERWCPAVLSALDHLYITIHWCVQLCERVRVFSYMSAIFSTKLQWDVTSVRRPSSCTLPTCVTKCGRERRDSVTSGVELLCRLDHLHVT